MVKPLFDRVVLKAIKEEEKTASGLFIPSANAGVSNIAEVVAVGPGMICHGDQIKMEVKVGDKVVFDKLKANDIKVDGQDLIVLSQKDILAVID